MRTKKNMDMIAVRIPQTKMARRPIERLIRLSLKRDRSLNYLAVEAILAYLDKEERRN